MNKMNEVSAVVTVMLVAVACEELVGVCGRGSVEH